MLENNDLLNIDLSDLQIEDVDLYLEEGSRGIGDFAASCGNIKDCGINSCSTTPTPPTPEVIV